MAVGEAWRQNEESEGEYWANLLNEVVPAYQSVRIVRSSSGQHQERFTIRTDIIIGHNRWSVDITLTNRAKMRYRMLLGRSAMKVHALVYPARTFLQGKPRLDSGDF